MSRYIIRLIVVYITYAQVLDFQRTRGLAAVDAAIAREFRYSMVADTSVGLVNPVMTWSGMSLVQCATGCSWEPTCANFLWNSLGGECTIGRGMEEDSGMMGNNSTKLYRVLRTCRYDLGYEMRTDGANTTQRCLFFSGIPATIGQAKQNCASHGGRLAKTNTRLLMDLVGDMAVEKGYADHSFGDSIGPGVLIGVDDLVSENVFVWSDGAMMTADERQLFSSGEPNNSGNEDCVVIYATSGLRTLNDDKCGYQFRYACEIDYEYV